MTAAVRTYRWGPAARARRTLGPCAAGRCPFGAWCSPPRPMSSWPWPLPHSLRPCISLFSLIFPLLGFFYLVTFPGRAKATSAASQPARRPARATRRTQTTATGSLDKQSRLALRDSRNLSIGVTLPKGLHSYRVRVRRYLGDSHHAMLSARTRVRSAELHLHFVGALGEGVSLESDRPRGQTCKGHRRLRSKFQCPDWLLSKGLPCSL